MSRLFWVDLRDWDEDAAKTAIESGADGIFVNADKIETVKSFGLVNVLSDSPAADLKAGTDFEEILITDKASENRAASVSKQKYAVVSTTDWTVIPLENLIAQSGSIIAVVKDEKEALTAAGVLEKGTAGILLKSSSAETIKKTAAVIKENTGRTDLVVLTIKTVTAAGMGDRVCVDTCSLLKDGEGMLVGNTSSAFFLVHAETLENPYVAPRPFRVNAGAVHAYAQMADGKTSYLSELKTGGRVLIAGADGNTKEAVIGRVKIERRPMLLITAECEGREYSVILQNAETIRLVSENGKAVSVIALKEGDRVLGRIEEGGRHFGHAVKETILEK